MMNGQQAPVSCDINDDIMEAGADAVSKAITEATQSATEESRKYQAEKLEEIYKGNFPWAFPLGAGAAEEKARLFPCRFQWPEVSFSLLH